ncbi:MAG: putative heme transporter [Solirubrobacteraceae bacterium]|nr:putative heme transporter [Solirubrobacteraceae bacterium]
MADESRQELAEPEKELRHPRDESGGADLELAAEAMEEGAEDFEERGAALLRDRRRVAGLVAAVVLLVVAIYVILPKVVGLNDVVGRLSDAHWYWVVIAASFNLVSFGSYSLLFRGVLGGRDEDRVHQRLDLRTSFLITMSGFVAAALFSAGGAGGIALTYWALRRAGMSRRRAACRMVAFLVLLYSVYLLALVVFGVLLRTGALHGDNPVGGTIVPAAIGGVGLAILFAVSFVPEDVQRGISKLRSQGTRSARVANVLASAVGTLASGIRTAAAHVRHPHRSALTLLGALGWWSGIIGVLWSSFHAFGVNVPFGVLVMGFFVGMVANLAPSPAGGVGTVDAGLIGAFVLFGVDENTVFPAILMFRIVNFWLPIPVGVWAFLRLRRTVRGWEAERPPATIQSKVTAETT